MRPALVILALLLAGCFLGWRAIPTTAPKPPFLAWIAVNGKSMLPKYPEAHLLEIDTNYPYAKLAIGDEVVFWDYRRDGGVAYTFHAIVAKQGGNFITQGLNHATNPRADSSWLTPDNYQGRATGRSTLMLLPDLSGK
jgi:hypothetical protein